MLRFVGDINLTDWDFNVGYGIGSRIVEGFDPFSHLKRSDEDCWIGNFEGVASDTSCKDGYPSNVFRVSPKALANLHHFDVYGFANNHAMQHGAEAYWNTVSALESFGSKVFGTSRQRTVVIEHQGRMLSLSGVSLRVDEFTQKPEYWYNPEYSELESENSLLPNNIFNVLFIHWGNEYINRPSSAQKKFAHWLIDAGFDLIIGMHPHVLQGYEVYKGKRIYYSLGNFVFDMPSEACKYGAIVSVDLERDEPVFKEEYIRIDETCSPQLVEERLVPESCRFAFLNKVLMIEDNSEQYHQEIRNEYRKYHKISRKHILKQICLHPRSAASLIKDFIKRRIV